MLEQQFIEAIAVEVSASAPQVAAAVALFEGGATIPFVARYRKDTTGNLNEVKLESVYTALQGYIALAQRRDAILKTIEQQGSLTDELRAAITACTDKATLEDLYLPYKKTRRTKATDAREKGLEPLADVLWAQGALEQPLEELAAAYVNAEKGVADADAALEGARHIVAERISTDAGARAALRDAMHDTGNVTSAPTKNTEGAKTKYEGYYAFSEPVKSIPSHRLLAILRGVKEGFLRMDLAIDDDAQRAALEALIIKDAASPQAAHLKTATADAYDRLLRPAMEREVIAMARKRADDDAIEVFRENAESLLLASPAGRIAVIGVDPGLRTGCKLAVVDTTGTFTEHAVIYPDGSPEQQAAAKEALTRLIGASNAKAIAIGNGTGSREAARFVNGVLKDMAEGEERPFTVLVNEAGASVYSASKVAREEFPDLDITIRGAISIARRLQDPLSELVKIEPRSIGVGQYQHDVNQKLLREGLHRTVVSCVNRVGVNLNTASVALLRYISGIQYGTAQNIVNWRTEHGGFGNRAQLMEIDGIGPKVYEQCAGFMRIPESDNALDGTAIHPESYPIVEKISESLEVPVNELVGNREALDKLDFETFATEEAGRYTLKDIRAELLRPGRDPRKEFKAPAFLDGVQDVTDLEEGMELEGIVTNVTNFGAFVDVGVHQDGLVHLSELANRFVHDPRDIVKVGEVVKVRVIGVDKDAPRISLSMKALDAAKPKPRRRPRKRAEGEAPAEGGAPAQAGAASDSRRSERPQGDRGPRKANGKSKRKGGKQGGKPQDRRQGQQHQEKQSAPLNTQLADQLEALKEKFSSNK